MKRLQMIMMCLFALIAASMSVKAQQVTITLMPGWTWISYPNAEVMDIATAMGDFAPLEGDRIKSQFGFSEYQNGQWMGGLQQFVPGVGYMYYSNRTEIVSFVFGEPAPQLIVTTAEPTDITAISAISGGSLSSSDGNYIVVLEKGICWATHPNPTAMNDFHTEKGSGSESFTSEMTDLSTNTVYYVRAYAVTLNGTTYGDELCFTTLERGYVDLGLPSGTLWATCNVGADTPEGYGDYFAWGETTPKDYYDWDTYQYSNGDYHQLIKYCNDSDWGYNGFIDNLTTLLPEDDAATTNWGNDWRMPTKEEWQELYQNTTYTWTTQNGVNGVLFTAANGNNLFMPAAGGRNENDLVNVDIYSCYWTRSLYTSGPCAAWYFCFGSNNNSGTMIFRHIGLSVRAVRSSLQSSVPLGTINGKFTINDDGNQVYFSQGNLQYIGSANTPYWKFAENQWDILGITTGQNSSDPNVDRDLFGWGTSGYNHGAICYEPWSTSTNSTYYFAYGIYYADLTGQADWGYNPINNGGGQHNQWRTLTSQEWNYVFNTRTTASGIRYAKAIVNGINGVILLPDNWSDSYYSLNNTNQNNASYSSNKVSVSQWNTLEQHGAIFLPAAGSRSGTSIINNNQGYYWSSSHTVSCSDYAGSVCFDNSSLGPIGSYYRSAGFSVRLVRNVE